jgi:nucleoside-diphosphate-sugar epimerase
MATVFVTGGSGFIGSRLIGRLTRDGHDVRALARSDAAAGKIAAMGATPVHGDLGDVASLAAAARGCEWAVHAAALTPGDAGPAAFHEANVEGTRNVLTACSGVERFVHVGTEAALRTGRPLIDVDETAPLRPDSTAPYAATKARAEQLVRERGGIVVRPCLVWGVGDTTALPQFSAAVRAGRFAWIDHGRAKVATTHVDNVVEGIVLAARKGTPGEAYFVTDEEVTDFRAFVTALLATQGLSLPDRSIPYRVAAVAAATMETLWRLPGFTGAPPLDRMAVWVTGRECTIDITKARAELGYAPVIDRAAGMAELAAAARTAGGEGPAPRG